MINLVYQERAEVIDFSKAVYVADQVLVSKLIYTSATSLPQMFTETLWYAMAGTL